MSEQQDLSSFTYLASAVSWPFFAIATIIFGMRTVARIWFTKASFGWDDFVISLSWFLDLVRMVTFHLALSATRQIDPANIPQTVPTAVFWSLFTDSWAFLSVTLPKVGVAILLVRIFRPRPWVRSIIMSMALGLFVVCIGGFIVCFVQCNPVAGQWNPYQYPETHCWPRNVQIDYALVGSSSSAALDFVFAVYPGFVIWSLQMPLWKKLSTMGLMSLGLASFAFAVIKVSNNATLLGNPTLNEVLTDALHIGLWNSIENDFVLIAACLPSVPPVFTVFRRYTGSKSSLSKSGFRSLRSGTRHAGPEEHALEIARNGQQPGWTDQSIHVKHDFSLHQEQVEPEGHGIPTYSFEA